MTFSRSQIIVIVICIILIVMPIAAGLWYFGLCLFDDQPKKTKRVKGRKMRRVRAEETEEDEDSDDDESDIRVEEMPVCKPRSKKRNKAPAPKAKLPPRRNPDPEALELGIIKAFVELRGEIHSVKLPCEGVTSWGALSQLIHEVCEDNGVPDLPVHGTMHIILNVDGKPVPVTGATRLAALQDASAIRVTIGDGTTSPTALMT